MLSVSQEYSLSKLVPLTQEPINDSPGVSEGSIFNHSGWVRCFSTLGRVEEEMHLNRDRVFASEIEKVQGVFDRFVDSMIMFGFDVNKPLQGHSSFPLHRAAYSGHVTILSSLIRRGGDVNACTPTTPLIEAARGDQVAAGRLLIRHGADVNKFSALFSKNDESLPLHYAISPEMCALLIENGCSVNARSKSVFHETALNWAAHCQRADTVHYLLTAGAIDSAPPGEDTALTVARKVDSGIYSRMMDDGKPKLPWVSRFVINLLEAHARSIP